MTEFPTSLPPRGVYPAPEGHRRLYWDGQRWDPRPVAGVWVRLVCFVVDCVIAVVLFATVYGPLLTPFGLLPTDQASDWVNAIHFAVLVVAFIAYFACCYRWFGRTPGMMLGRLYVVGLDTGTNMTWGRAIIRATVLVVGIVCGLTAIIWLVITASSRSRQGPHDSAARSIVLRSARPSSARGEFTAVDG